MFIDTHVHLNSKELGMHLDEVISDAFANNVKKMIVVGYDLETSKKAIELAHQFDWCYAAVGFHPTEIKKLLTETKNLNRPIICVFQPHTFSRTQKYFNDFLSSFENTYQTIFYKTYKAREKHIKGADSKDLFVALKQKQNVYYYNNFNKIIKHLKKYSKPNCIVLFVGAGDIYDIKNLII